MPTRDEFQFKYDCVIRMCDDGCLVEAWETIEEMHTEAQGPDEKKLAETAEGYFFEQNE